MPTDPQLPPPLTKQGDLIHWARLLDAFDAYLEKCARRADVQLDGGEDSGGGAAAADAEPLPAAGLCAVLNATAAIFESCGSNKQAYASFEHLTALLAAPDAGVVSAALGALGAYLRKPHHSLLRWQAPPALTARLLQMSRG